MRRVDLVKRAACGGGAMGLVWESVSGRGGGGMMAKYREGAGFKLGRLFYRLTMKGKQSSAGVFAVFSERMDSDPVRQLIPVREWHSFV